MPRRVIPVVALALAAGCSNPLARRDADLGHNTPEERLRRIDTLNINRFAKPAPPPNAPAEDPAKVARARFESLGTMSLSVEQARASAMEHNLDLQVALVNPTISAAKVDQEQARFESAFTLRALHQDTDSPTSSSLVGGQDKFDTIQPGVTIPLRTGGTANIAFPFSRDDNNNAPALFNPSYQAALDLSISHPLLRNAGRSVNTVAIEVANYNRQITEAQAKLAIINQLTAVERSYWRLYQARRDLEVRQQDYELAQTQLERAKRVVNAGKQAEIEVIRAEAGVADRLGSILIAQNTVLSQQRELKRVINMPGLEIDSKTLVVPATDPAPVEYLVDPPALTEAAIANRMEMLELELQLLADAANLRFDRNQLLPQLDLDASYNIGGIGTSGENALHQVQRNHFESWTLGATLTVPLGNEDAKSRLRQGLLTRLQRLTTREARKLLIRQEVLEAVDRIEAGWQRILAARQATLLSSRSLQAEQRQFDLGASTSTDVLIAATNLAQARLSEVQAVVDYQLAQVDLAASTGTLLGADHILWRPSDPASQPDREEPTLTPGGTGGR